uniref:Protein max n=1 Tax=Anthurium amnicola TaxID=1678845 RepID=A0A1D1YSD3_9ARAE
MGTINGGNIVSFAQTPSLHVVANRMPSNGCANITFQIPSFANAAKKSTNSAERRANHNAVERARRECLNTKFQELAHALPSLAQVRRPSKSTIVQKSLEFILTTRQKERRHEREMRQLIEENSSFREEINRLRAELGLELLPPREETQPKDCSDTNDNTSTTTNTQTSTMTEDIGGNNTSTTTSPILEKKNHEADDNTQSTVNTSQQSTLPELDSNTVMDIQTSMYTPRSDTTSRSDDDCGGISESELDDKHFGSVDESIENSECLYEDPAQGMFYLDNFSQEFGFPMGLPMDIVDHTGLSLEFDQDLRAMTQFCSPFTANKYYPSPPYEAAMLNYPDNMPGFTMSQQSPHM